MLIQYSQMQRFIKFYSAILLLLLLSQSLMGCFDEVNSFLKDENRVTPYESVSYSHNVDGKSIQAYFRKDGDHYDFIEIVDKEVNARGYMSVWKLARHTYAVRHKVGYFTEHIGYISGGDILQDKPDSFGIIKIDQKRKRAYVMDDCGDDKTRFNRQRQAFAEKHGAKIFVDSIKEINFTCKFGKLGNLIRFVKSFGISKRLKYWDKIQFQVNTDFPEVIDTLFNPCPSAITHAYDAIDRIVKTEESIINLNTGFIQDMKRREKDAPVILGLEKFKKTIEEATARKEKAENQFYKLREGMALCKTNRLDRSSSK